MTTYVMIDFSSGNSTLISEKKKMVENAVNSTLISEKKKIENTKLEKSPH